ncbi:MAG: type II secretion system GspH family protein [bacterium]|nr:type II secretion system GspH family protein [bacterium]
MLLEVIVSLTILGISVAAFMRSFTQSLGAARRMEVQTQACFFAQQLFDEFEINPPPEGKSEGGFGDDYKYYSYRLEVKYEEPVYHRLENVDQVERFYPIRTYRIEINYDDGAHKPYTALALESAIVGFEKFAYNSKLDYQNF